MWLFGEAELNVWEFTSTHVKQAGSKVVPGMTKAGKPRKGIHKRHYIPVKPCEMMVALARSGATLSPSAPVGFWRAMGAVGRFQEACTVVGKDLLAVQGLISQLRDSTRTALAGDLGQAVTWLLAKKLFHATAVVDFGKGCALLSPPVPSPTSSDSRPDFIASPMPWSNITLLESKGGIQTTLQDVKWREGLANGLVQTSKGRLWLQSNGQPGLVSKELAVSFALVEKPSSIAVFADPEELGPRELPESSRLALIRAHFGAWASSGGGIDLAELLLQPEGTESSIANAVDAMPTMMLHGRQMRVLLPDARLRRSLIQPVWPPSGLFEPILQLADAEVLQALADGNLARIAAGMEAFQRTLQRLDAQRPEADLIRASFADGTIYTAV